MTDNRTTELREKLTERGVKIFHSGPNVTYFETPYGEAQATEYELGVFGVMMKDLTPEQAIAATLGSDREIELGNALNEVAEKWSIAQVEAEDCAKRCVLLEELVQDWQVLYEEPDYGDCCRLRKRMQELGIEVIDE